MTRRGAGFAALMRVASEAVEIVLRTTEVHLQETEAGQGALEAVDGAGGGGEDLVQPVAVSSLGGSFGERVSLFAFESPVAQVRAGRGPGLCSGGSGVTPLESSRLAPAATSLVAGVCRAWCGAPGPLPSIAVTRHDAIDGGGGSRHPVGPAVASGINVLRAVLRRLPVGRCGTGPRWLPGCPGAGGLVSLLDADERLDGVLLCLREGLQIGD